MRVGDVGFEVRIPSLLFTIVAKDVEVVRGDTELSLPQASAMFSPASLMMFRPLDVVLSGLDLDVTLEVTAGAVHPQRSCLRACCPDRRG